MVALPARIAEVGGLTIRRAFPRRGLRTVGPWCFADHFGPEVITPERGLDVGPHPHIGLRTVTWLLDGAVTHRDSLGSDQLIRPGQLNLMTAGNGVVHAEQADRIPGSTLHGLQLWVAQHDTTRHGAATFAHHSNLPQIDLHNGQATVFIGEFGGALSPADVTENLLGMDLELGAGTAVLPIRPDWEYAVYVVSGEVTVTGAHLNTGASAGELVPVATGLSEVTFTTQQATRLLVLGGAPLAEALFMWWNFVGRSRAEVAQALADWANFRNHGDDTRFGRVETDLPSIPAPALP
ncbi:MAG: pirin family protein [Candidatus Nanopelagicales bacterium]